MAELRQEFTKGGLEASLLAAQLLEMVEKLQAQLRSAEALAASALREAAAREADYLERELAHASASGGCPTCHDARSRAVLARLRAVAGAVDPQGEPRRRGR